MVWFRRPRVTAMGVTTTGLIVFSVVLVLFIIIRQAGAIDRLRANYDGLHASYEQLYEEALDAGAHPDAPAPEDIDPAPVAEPRLPIPGPSGSPGKQGRQGEQGERGPGPTDEQVRDGVDDYCSVDGRCSEPPAFADVVAAVVQVCADGACDGEDGADGSNGSDGADGQNATAEMVSAAVQSYCSAGACTGPKGDTGPKPTAEELRSLVEQAIKDYCAARPSGTCVGPQGDQGPKGPQGEPGKFQPGDAKCSDGEYVWRVTVEADGNWTALCRGLLG